MSKLIPEDRWDDLAALEEDLTQRRLPAEFYTLYERFIYEYSCRGPLEMEIANEKYGRLAYARIAAVEELGDRWRQLRSAYECGHGGFVNARTHTAS